MHCSSLYGAPTALQGKVTSLLKLFIILYSLVHSSFSLPELSQELYMEENPSNKEGEIINYIFLKTFFLKMCKNKNRIFCVEIFHQILCEGRRINHKVAAKPFQDPKEHAATVYVLVIRNYSFIQ